MPRKKKIIGRGERVVVFTPDPDDPGYGHVVCNWEDKPREQKIAASVVNNFAAGWHAELRTKAAW